MSSTITYTLLPAFSLYEAPVLLWLSMIRAQPNSEIRVLEGNTDTREKDISKIRFYSDAICSKGAGPWSTWEKESLGCWEFCLAPDQRTVVTLSERERARNCCHFSLVRKNILYCEEGESQKLFFRLPWYLQSWAGQNLTAQAMLAVGLALKSSLFPCWKASNYFLDWAS